MSNYVFDLEANGLNPDRVWCIVFKDTETGEFTTFHDEHGMQIQNCARVVNFINKAELLIGHNILGYDIKVLQNLFDIGVPNSRFIDTLVWSRLIRPARINHSIESYGEEYGIRKPTQEQWEVWDDNMLHRCKEDVNITEEVWRGLVQETEDWQGYCLRKKVRP